MIDIKNKKLIYDFDKSEFNFYEIFKNFFGAYSCNLEDIHEYFDKSILPSSLITVENDQNQEIYKILYSIDEGYSLKDKSIYKRGKFLSLYDKFINYIAQNIFNENLVYQNRPTLRSCVPNNKAVGDWHRDRDYNHPIEEINIWVPITNAFGSNTIWIESEFDKEDYSPININNGQILIFDSSLKHGNVLNKESKTRLSFDFRVILKSKYKKPKSSKSYSQGIDLKIGDYYSITSI